MKYYMYKKIEIESVELIRKSKLKDHPLLNLTFLWDKETSYLIIRGTDYENKKVAHFVQLPKQWSYYKKIKTAKKEFIEYYQNEYITRRQREMKIDLEETKCPRCKSNLIYEYGSGNPLTSIFSIAHFTCANHHKINRPVILKETHNTRYIPEARYIPEESQIYPALGFFMTFDF